ncbi:hypothetical protein [Rickettsia hoogstraalii]|nr:hypothetical protein [Rickettsia hoogstraalii]
MRATERSVAISSSILRLLRQLLRNFPRNDESNTQQCHKNHY